MIINLVYWVEVWNAWQNYNTSLPSPFRGSHQAELLNSLKSLFSPTFSSEPFSALKILGNVGKGIHPSRKQCRKRTLSLVLQTLLWVHLQALSQTSRNLSVSGHTTIWQPHLVFCLQDLFLSSACTRKSSLSSSVDGRIVSLILRSWKQNTDVSLDTCILGFVSDRKLLCSFRICSLKFYSYYLLLMLPWILKPPMREPGFTNGTSRIETWLKYIR